MKCTKCNKNEATVFYREIINGKETKYALCHECALAKEKEMNASVWGDMNDIFSGGFLGNIFAPGKARIKEEKKCTLCKATFRQLCEEGKTGCPVCYSVFREELSPTLSRLHGSATHKGRVPSALREKKQRDDEITSLEKKLKEAIASENYEDAAVYRDKLRDMRAQ